MRQASQTRKTTDSVPRLQVWDECRSCFGRGKLRVGWEDEKCSNCGGGGVHFEVVLDDEPVTDSATLRGLRSEIRAWAVTNDHKEYVIEYEGSVEKIKTRWTLAERRLLHEIETLKAKLVERRVEPGENTPALLRDGIVTSFDVRALYEWWNRSYGRYGLATECKRALIDRTLKLAERRGWNVSRSHHPAASNGSYSWVIYVETPWGQASWHVGADEHAEIPDLNVKWSGIRNSEQVLEMVYSIPENQAPLSKETE